jgi:hypothetical protein
MSRKSASSFSTNWRILGFQTGKYVYCSRSHGNQRFQGGPELAVAFFVLLDVKGYFDLPRLQFARLFFIGT